MYIDFKTLKICWQQLLILCLFFSFGFGQNSRFEPNTVISKSNPLHKIQYITYLPTSKKAEKSNLPLIVYLHHNSAVGNDLNLVKNSGLMRILNEGKTIPFIVVAPQLSSDMNMTWDPKLVNEVVKDAVKRYNADSLRITVTGYSLGANGALNYASSFPKNILAVIPAAGWGNPSEACKLKEIPFWAFHGVDDKIVNPQSTRGFSASLKNCGGYVRLTEFSNRGHNIWRETYSYQGLFEWLSDLYNVKSGFSNNNAKELISSIKIPKALSSVSGITYSKIHGYLGVNETNPLPILINFDSTGAVKRTIRILNSSNISWQDMTQDKNGMIFIADVGNEKFTRKSIQIYSFNESDLLGNQIKPERTDIILTDFTSLNYKTIFYYENSVYSIGIDKKGEHKLVRLISTKNNPNNQATLIGSLPKDTQTITSSYFDYYSNTLYLTNPKSVIKIKFGIDNTEVINEWDIKPFQLPFSNQNESITVMGNNRIAIGDRGVWGANDSKVFIFSLK